MNDQSIVETARQRLADLWLQPYTKNAILDGQWDSGKLMQNMIDIVTREAASNMEETLADD